MREEIGELLEEAPLLPPDDSVGEALRRLSEDGVPFALVRVEGRWRYVTPGTLAGIPRTRALMDAGLPEAPEVPPDLLVREALGILEREGGEALVVTEKGRPLGVLRRSKVLEYLLDQAERARETAEELAAVFRASPLPILVVDEDLRVLEMNDVLSECMGVPLGEAVGRIAGEALGCVHAEGGCGSAPACEGCGIRRAVSSTFKKERPHRDLEATVKVRMGDETRELHVLVNTALLSHRGRRAVVVALQDVTEKRKLLKELKELNENLERKVQERTFELQVLYELSQQIGHTLSYSDLFKLVLRYLHRILPYDVAGSLLVVDDLKEMFIKKARPLPEEVLGEVRRLMLERFVEIGGRKLEPEDVEEEIIIEAHNYRADAPPISRLRTKFFVPLVVDDKTIGLVFAGAEAEDAFSEERREVLDTLVQQAAISVQRLKAVLAAEKTRLEAAIEEMREGVVILDRERMITVANPRAREFLPLLTKARLGGKRPVRQFGGVELDVILEMTRSGKHQEVVVPGPPERTFEITASPFGKEGSKGTVIVIRDVTEEREAQRMQAQQERLAAVGQMAGGIAHDFNNILSVIMGYAEIALMKVEPESELGECLRTIISQGRRAARLVRQVLDFSRRSTSEPRPMDLLPFLKETVKFLKSSIPENIELSLKAEPGTYTVNADPTQMQQVVMNLAVNARDAMPGGGKLEIGLDKVELGEEVRSWDPELAPGRYILVTVRDTGTGMPPEVLERAFDPFFTTKEPGRGTGLGLSQVYGIVKQHKGHISIESEVGRGTSVSVYLPELVQEAPPEEEGEEEVPRGSETVLVVEDEERVRESLRGILEGLGYKVLTASDGEEGVRLYGEHLGKIDLVLSDMVMPRMGGRELYRRLKEMDPDARVLILSGYGLGEEVRELISEGVVGFVQKPISMRELARKLRKALEGRSSGTNPDIPRRMV